MTALLEIWKTAVWLCDAPDTLTAVRRRKPRPTAQFESAASKQLAERNPQAAAILEAFTQSLGSLGGDLAAAKDFRDRQLNSLIGLIEGGDLIGLGYNAATLIDEGPVRIPAHLFEAEYIDIKNSRIKSSQFEFTKVKIEKSSAFTTLALDQIRQESDDIDPPGLKGREKILMDIVDALRTGGELAGGANVKALHRAVVIIAKRDYPSEFLMDRGLSYKNFAGYLRKHLKS